MSAKLEARHCAADLRDYLRELAARRARNVEAAREMGGDLTPVQEARFDVGFRLLLDLERDLRELAECWEAGHPGRRSTEESMK